MKTFVILLLIVANVYSATELVTGIVFGKTTLWIHAQIHFTPNEHDSTAPGGLAWYRTDNSWGSVLPAVTQHGYHYRGVCVVWARIVPEDTALVQGAHVFAWEHLIWGVNHTGTNMFTNYNMDSVIRMSDPLPVNPIDNRWHFYAFECIIPDSSWMEGEELRRQVLHNFYFDGRFVSSDTGVVLWDTPPRWSANQCDLPAFPGYFMGLHIAEDTLWGQQAYWDAWNFGKFDYSATETPSTNYPKITLSNYPNPCNPSTTIQFCIPHPVETSLKVFSLDGKLMNVLVDKEMLQGSHSLPWSPTASGQYVCRLRAGDVTETKVINVMK